MKQILNIRKRAIETIILFLLLLAFSNNYHAQTVVNYPANGTFTVPAGVSQVMVECWGGGGAGGAGGVSNAQGGGGGAGGQYVKSIISVVSGATYNVTVGAGVSTASANGNDSWFLSNTTIIAKGGQGGASYASGAAGGLGSTTNGIGDVIYSGGNGANGGAGLSGGGGGGAGSTGNGGNASGTTAGTGTTVNGGNGGAGNTSNGAAGGAGNTYGGAGGGATKSSTPGSGAQGYVRISYCSDATLPAIPANPTVSLSGCTVTITATGTPPAGVTWFWQGTSCGSSTTLGSGSTYNPTSSGMQYIRARDNTTGCWSLGCGSVSTIIQQPVIITNPISRSGCIGSSVSFSVTATGAGLTYQWRKGGVNIGGATSDTYTIPSIIAGDAGNYDCIITGTCGTATSTAATLTIITTGLTGTKTVGSGGDYTTLKLAFDAINTNGLSGNLRLEIISDITETAEARLNQWTDCSGATGYTVTIYPTGALGTTRTISGNIATSLVTFNGADNVTIDGRLGMTGAANSLVFTNSNATTGSTIKFINDATKNVIKYTSIQGASASYTTGIVFFSTASTLGNINNSIESSSIYGTAYTGLYSEGTVGMENKDNAIFSCNFYNVNTTLGCYISGIDLEGGNTRWTINTNSFYVTSTTSDINYWPLLINSPNGNEYKVTNNYIGGQSPNAGGSSLTISNTGYILTLYGINVTVSNSGVSEITNNYIKNINFTTYPSSTGTVRFLAISSTGRINVNNNIIGDELTGSIVITINANSTYSGGVTGIIKNGDGTVNNNKIGSFSINGTISAQLLFNAIQITGSLINDVTISGNIIGNANTANSIQSAAGATPGITFGGIFFGTAGSYHTTVSNNIIANVNIGCTSTRPFFIGLNNQGTGGSQTIIGNSIYNITTASSSAGYFSTPTDFPAICGIRTNNTTAGSNLNISSNVLHSLHATNATADVTIFGIHAGTATSGTHIINGNYIHSLTTINPSLNVWQEGIVLTAGTATISNNMIRLSGNSVNTDNYYVGIYNGSTSTNSILFNSVYIGGTATGSQNTFSFARGSTGTTNIRNNIFVNARSGGTGSHYAYYLAGVTNLTSNYNIYSNGGAGVLAYVNAVVRTTLGTIQTGTGQDGSSIVADPLFVNPTGNSTTVDLDIQATSPAIGKGIAGTGILTDFDSQVRSTGVSPNGPCIGADERIAAPYGTNTYGIYSPDGIAGTITDCEIVALGGPPGGIGYLVAKPTDANWANVGISSYQVITAKNYSCTGVDLTFTTTDGTPDWLFGNGSNPTSGTATPIITQYSSTGRKDILESIKIFKDFVNITMPAPSPGTILGAPSGAGCPTTYTYTSSVAGSSGFTYTWQCIAPGGCSATVASPYTSSTDITFVNQTGINQVFVVTLDIVTECCGPLRQVTRYITIYPGPTQPTVTGSPFSICTGGALTLAVNIPNPAYSYEWFDALTGGTMLGTGTTYDIVSAPSGTNNYYVQSTNSYSCSSQRTQVVVVGTNATAPVVPNQTTCGVNDVTLYITGPQPGYTYNWYLTSCGGTLLQSSTSSNFTYNITATTNFYVSAVPPGCSASACATATVTYMLVNPITWLGAVGGANNWFNTLNWTSGCLPTCASDVIIPNLAIDPDIGFDATHIAEAKDINLQAGAVLSFSDSKAKLMICGNFTHAGILTTNNLGRVDFTGTTAQTYARTGTGAFNNVNINNTAASPSVTITSGNMDIGTVGNLTFQNGLVIASGTNYLIINNPSTTSISGYGSDRYVSGNLRRYITAGTYTYPFPIGNASRYTIAELINTGLTGVSYIDAKFLSAFSNGGAIDPAIAIDEGTPYSAIATEGIWQLDANAAVTGGSYSIKLWFDDGGGGSPFSGLLDNHFGPLKRPSASILASDWTSLGGTLNTIGTPGRIVSGGFAQRTGWSSFSQYAIGVTVLPLPIELLTFGANYNGKSVDLAWITQSEINNDYFIVEKSINAIDFYGIGKVLSQADGGNSQRHLSYTFNDDDVNPGTYYYRLKQIDIDGEFMYSETASVIIGENGVFTIQPNPAKDQVEITYYCFNADNPTLKMYDDKSRLIIEKELSCIKGQNKAIIDIGNFSQGVYLITLSGKSGIERAKLIKQ
ncbi:MAG: hypothetical protein CVU05_00905 [Bacteroidetes bacterium HGW-Bacteroidetes-21]|nr:MAG: hypothetical protein CVU05_00905 [Bacteroidetes bacterium HGW-Bacteroidetes-21]